MKALKKYIEEWDSNHKEILEKTILLLDIQERIKETKIEI
jgi:hypothetical protein